MRRVMPYLALVGWALLALAMVLVVAWTLHHVHLAEPYRDPDSRADTRVWGQTHPAVRFRSVGSHAGPGPIAV
jgi:hypothetical protein